MRNNIPSYSDAELLELLVNLKSDRVERKRSFKNESVKARQAVCAFANDLPDHNLPGILFIGAKAKGGASNIKIDDELLKSLADMRNDGDILPMPVIHVEKRTLNGAQMAIVTVMPSDLPPLRYKGRIWVCAGPRRLLASIKDERILNDKRRLKDLPFDLHPVPRATIDILSKVIFENEYLQAAFAPDVLKENNRTYEEGLSSCKMIVSIDETTPTILGVLNLGKIPQDYLPCAYVQFLRIDGKELIDPIIDQEVIKGTMFDVIRRTEDKLRSHNRTAVDLSQGRHIVSTDYPHVAFQQILYNAVMHRTYEGTNAPVRVYWYNDRVEFNSPGGPFGIVSHENFGRSGVTDYRNPNIADALKTIGFIQRYGIGIQTAKNAMMKNGNPEIEFMCDDNIVLCTMRTKEDNDAAA